MKAMESGASADECKPRVQSVETVLDLTGKRAHLIHSSAADVRYFSRP